MPAQSLENYLRRFKMDKEKLQSHLTELKKKHRELDEKIIELSIYHVSAELRQMKTQKLWLKDEIYRVEKQLQIAEDNINGF